VNLVTGASGLLGSHIVEKLCRIGRPVRVVVRPTSDTSWLKTLPVEIVRGDVTDEASLESALQGVSNVFHAAARVGDWGPWSDFKTITIDGTSKLVRVAERAKIRRFVHISSISVYGYVDGEGQSFDEQTQLGQHLYKWAYYTRAKIEAEKIVWEANRRGHMPCTVIRPSWLYGERDRTTIGRLIDSIREGRAMLIGDGDNRLNVVHAGNVAEACILAADLDVARGQAYNCSNDGVLTQKEYFNAVARALDCPPVSRRIPYRAAYSAALLMECLYRMARSRKPPLITRYSVWLIGRRCFFETSKAREQLGWKSSVSYEQGIPAAVQDYLQRTSQRPPGRAAPGSPEIAVARS
jgi:nucleoside-diphosphate-sugar epimerase